MAPGDALCFGFHAAYALSVGLKVNLIILHRTYNALI